MRKYFLLIASAVSGACAFEWPHICWWLIFFFMIPLFWYQRSEDNPIAWRAGRLWGIAFFGLHSRWIFWLMHEKSQVPWLGLIAGALFIGFCALNAMIWFVCASWLSTVYKKRWFSVVSLSLTGTIFWWWVDNGIFWISGQWDGYPMAFPLVPLATIPHVLYLAPWFSMIGLLACLMIFESLIALALCDKSFILGMMGLLFLTPFLVGFFISRDRHDLPSWANRVGYVALSGCHECDINKRAKLIGTMLAQFHAGHPQARLIVMPESTCAFALNENPHCAAMWDTVLGHEDITLVVGGHECEHGALFNTFYCVCKGQIIDRHHKVHCIPLVERIPAPWSRVPFFSSLFLKGYHPFSVGLQQDQVIKINDCTFIPMICSELFFAKSEPKVASEIPILCLVNDSWFIPYMRHLLYLAAQCKAIVWRRVILYVGHYGAFWILPDGSAIPIEM